MTTEKKPNTTRFPNAVLSWIATRLRQERVLVDLYRDMIADSYMFFDHTVTPTRKRLAATPVEILALCTDLLERFLPGESMPPTAEKRRPPRPKAAPAPEPPAPPPVAVQLELLSPADRARHNGIGVRS
jgi:hypothetical protein